jgi:hypothetical protein
VTNQLHPAHLSTLGALASLEVARRLLVDAAGRAASADQDDRGTLQAWRPGSGIHSSGHADLLDRILAGQQTVANPYAVRLSQVHETLVWLAGELFHRVEVDPLAQLQTAVPALTPQAASRVELWVTEQDQAARQLLAEPADRQLWPAVECPACFRAGVLAIRTSTRMAGRTVECTVTTCRCAGTGCPCGMGVQVLGHRHLWTLEQICGVLA